MTAPGMAIGPFHHLGPKAPVPQLWCTWEGEFTIQDIIALQDFKVSEGSDHVPSHIVMVPENARPGSL